jgi:hypothetical protein
MAPHTSPPLIYQLKITLKDIEPPIWRRVWVDKNATLSHLHWVIQIAMGWTNSHLHSFTIQGVGYGVPMPELDFDGTDVQDEHAVMLSDFASGELFKFSYLYDFGDSWEHEILVEKVLLADPNVHCPVCIQAERACPPEDCGGVRGYQEFLAIIQAEDHPEHDAMLEWVGGFFDPDDPELGEANVELSMLAQRQYEPDG